ncbi:hypothetical protein JCM10207_006223 [Rhodosporidiobolus poonsookiae]
MTALLSAAHPFASVSMPLASSSPFSPPNPASSSSSGATYAPASAAVDEDDLLALLSSDQFSLESPRDAELLRLSSLLKSVIPTGNSQLHHPQPPSLAQASAGIAMSAQQQLANPLSSWNGWRPSAGDAPPYGSPMSLSSGATHNGYTAPSSSLNTNASASPFTAPAFPLSPPASSSPAYASPRGAASSRGRSQASAIGMGYRAPACSRERVPTLASFGAGGPAAAVPEQEAAFDGGGWKSRLRSAKHAAEQLEGDEDAMME